MKRALLLGCGSSRQKKVKLTTEEPWEFVGYELITADMDPDCKPTYVCSLPWGLPPGIGTFDEIHAYDSLEHWGKQGDWRGWLDEMSMYHDLLNPGGHFFCTVPIGEERFVDCGHTRFFGDNWFWILSRAWYDEQAAKGFHVGDYRWYWKKDFLPVVFEKVGDPHHHLCVALRKV